jgi:uncharacterized protein YceK
MKSRVTLVSLILFVIVLYGCSSLVSLSVPSDYLEYSLTPFKDMLILDIQLNGSKAKLLIDTGASKSLLNINRSEQYGFEYITFLKNKYVGIGGLTDIYAVYGYEVDLFHVNFLGADLDEITRYFKEDGLFIVGIIGSDFLKNNGAIIDYSHSKLYMKK